MKAVIYYNKERMEALKPVFDKLHGCEGCKKWGKYFAASSNRIIKNPENPVEESFNELQKEAYANGYVKTIYSWVI